MQVTVVSSYTDTIRILCFMFKVNINASQFLCGRLASYTAKSKNDFLTLGFDSKIAWRCFSFCFELSLL